MREEQERAAERVERLARSFASAVFYLAENDDPRQAAWVVTPLAPAPESQNLDGIVAKLHAEQMEWVCGLMATPEERALFAEVVAAIQDGSYGSSSDLRDRAAKSFGYRREYELTTQSGAERAGKREASSRKAAS